jgi:hypothetical protein
MHRFEQEVPPLTTIWDQVYDNHDSNLTLEIYKDCALDESPMGCRHPLAPPILPDAFRHDRAGPIEAVERDRNVQIELRTIERCAIADAVDHCLGNTLGIAFGLHTGWRDRAD